MSLDNSFNEIVADIATKKPEILAPSGDMQSYLAAMAAGADAVYLGLKAFSARMEAENFSSTDLGKIIELSESLGKKVYVAFNTMLKESEIQSVARSIARITRDIQPHGLIVQDPSMLNIAKDVGYSGKLILSTLSCATHSSAILSAHKAGADRIVLPRELSIDEIREIDANCPDNLELEMFVHGALCWCVSGRCYWSSYMGGKSGLRGRCVQPCRRMYEQRGKNQRAFSCLDLSLDVLVKTTLNMPHIASWKIEGRKKSPHYVYHVTYAYRLLRDEGSDPKAKKEALAILDMALGRKTTRAHFLPQKDTLPTNPDLPTGSGLLIGKVHLDEKGVPTFKPYQKLMKGDYLRIGTEDESWHSTLPVLRPIPKAGTFFLKLAKHKTPKSGTPVFLVDRREPDLIEILNEWQKKIDAIHKKPQNCPSFELKIPSAKKKIKKPDMHLLSQIPHGSDTKARGGILALWLTPNTIKAVSRTITPKIAWWLPPVIWQDEEEMYAHTIFMAVRDGASHFVLNSPWQTELFDESKRHSLDFIAGPFCNLANTFAMEKIREMGFSAAIVSPELSKEDFLVLPKSSPIPLGFVISGFYPVGLARHAPIGIKFDEPFKSPKGEIFWMRKYGQNTWVYPGWQIDFSKMREALNSAGYSFFVEIQENPPKSLPNQLRPGLFNWNGTLL